MKIDILTLFPAMFEGFLNESIIKRARERKLVEINVHDIRNFTLDKNKKVDDYGYGGGKGMVLMPEPVVRAIEEYKTIDTTVILMCPQGEKYTEKKAFDLSLKKHMVCFTEFLDPTMCAKTCRMLRYVKDLRLVSFGGYEESEEI